MSDFRSEVIAAGGEGIAACYQCGTCSGGCPTVAAMDYTPRQIIRMVNLGMRDRVLSSRTIWLCASCYQCQVRCPREVKITEVMAALKGIAMKEGYNSGIAKPRAASFYRTFNEIVANLGRQFEPLLLMKTALGSRESVTSKLGYLLKSAPFGIMLMKKGKLPFKPEKISGSDEVRRIFENVAKMEARE
jgi:heterodisulfide reductase subunit C